MHEFRAGLSQGTWLFSNRGERQGAGARRRVVSAAVDAADGIVTMLKFGVRSRGGFFHAPQPERRVGRDWQTGRRERRRRRARGAVPPLLPRRGLSLPLTPGWRRG